MSTLTLPRAFTRGSTLVSGTQASGSTVLGVVSTTGFNSGYVVINPGGATEETLAYTVLDAVTLDIVGTTSFSHTDGQVARDVMTLYDTYLNEDFAAIRTWVRTGIGTDNLAASFKLLPSQIAEPRALSVVSFAQSYTGSAGPQDDYSTYIHFAEAAEIREISLNWVNTDASNVEAKTFTATFAMKYVGSFKNLIRFTYGTGATTPTSPEGPDMAFRKYDSLPIEKGATLQITLSEDGGVPQFITCHLVFATLHVRR